MNFVRVQAEQIEDDETVGIGIVRLNLENVVAYWKNIDGKTRLLLPSGEMKDIAVIPENIDTEIQI